MRTAAAAASILVGLVASPLAAQDRDRAQGIPPGHLPPPGECRVWYDNRPAGQQPPPTSCREAEWVASRDRYARVIYGGPRDDRWRDRDDDRWRDHDGDRDRGRAIPRGHYPYPESYPYPAPYPYPERYPYPDRSPSSGYSRIPFDNGYKDGYDKGRQDGGDRHAYDPERQGRYRSADRGYDRRYGTKEQYKAAGYRDGFRAGYDDGYRDAGGDRRRGRSRWPF